MAAIDEWIEHCSGWIVVTIKGMYVNISKYAPLRGGRSYILLPDFLQNKNATDKCFSYSILYWIGY